MDGAVGKRRGERLVHTPVLLHQGEADEGRGRHDHLKVVAAASAVDHVELGRVRERALEELTERLCAHGSMVPGGLMWAGVLVPLEATSSLQHEVVARLHGCRNPLGQLDHDFRPAA